DPPGSETLARLVAGAVILVGQRPDGGLALRLNPGFEVGLWLSARRPGKPALTTTLALAEDPELARWLLDYFLRSDPPAPPAPGPLADSLRRHGILVNELPPPEANFPDPGLPPDPAADLSTAARLIPQGAGQGVPVDARHLLGRHTPRLPAGTAIAWAVDAGTNLVFPALTDAEAVPAPARVPGLLADVRAEAWNQQVNTAKRELEQNRYAVLREIVPPGPRAQLRHYVRQLVERGYFPALGDGQVELRSAIHNEPTIASLHLGLARIVSRFCGETVQASYCYLSCYEAGAVLLRHRDRPQCNYNLSLVLDMQGPDGEPPPWPIYLELDGRPLPVLLEVGDGLVYSGTELWHWRDALPPGQRAIVCFFHFVPGNFAGSLD
ncbi:MAG: hypothetical protein ABI567_07680, partial [Gammaproteobacteria bacterium]